MNATSIAKAIFVAQNAVDITARGHGNYNVTLSFYESSLYRYRIHSSPYFVALNQHLFLQATLHSSDTNLVLFLDTCEASPNANDFTSVTYDLIRSG